MRFPLQKNVDVHTTHRLWRQRRSCYRQRVRGRWCSLEGRGTHAKFHELQFLHAEADTASRWRKYWSENRPSCAHHGPHARHRTYSPKIRHSCRPAITSSCSSCSLTIRSHRMTHQNYKRTRPITPDNLTSTALAMRLITVPPAATDSLSIFPNTCQDQRRGSCSFRRLITTNGGDQMPPNRSQAALLCARGRNLPLPLLHSAHRPRPAHHTANPTDRWGRLPRPWRVAAAAVAAKTSSLLSPVPSRTPGTRGPAGATARWAEEQQNRCWVIHRAWCRWPSSGGPRRARRCGGSGALRGEPLPPPSSSSRGRRSIATARPLRDRRRRRRRPRRRRRSR